MNEFGILRLMLVIMGIGLTLLMLIIISYLVEIKNKLDAFRDISE